MLNTLTLTKDANKIMLTSKDLIYWTRFFSFIKVSKEPKKQVSNQSINKCLEHVSHSTLLVAMPQSMIFII